MSSIGMFFYEHRTLWLWGGPILVLWGHYAFDQRDFLLLGFSINLILTGALTYLTLLNEPGHELDFWQMAVMLATFGSGLYVALSDGLKYGLARYLTRKRGEKWVKELDYIYLWFGIGGIVLSLYKLSSSGNQVRLGLELFGPMLFITAVVIRMVKTRVEIAGWNTRKFHKL